MLNFTLATTLIAVFLVSRLIKFCSGVNKVLHLPGLRSIFHPLSVLGGAIPHGYFNPGATWQWHWRNQIYQRVGSRTISVVALLSGEPAIYTTSPELARQIVSTRGTTEKAPESTIFLAYKLVWREAASLFDEMVEAEQWTNKRPVLLTPINRLTTKFSLSIMTRCAFGSSEPWLRDQQEDMDFTEAMMIVSRSPLIRYITPYWLYKLPFKPKIDTAHRIVDNYMRSLAQARRASILEGTGESSKTQKDLFDYLVQSSIGEGAAAMTDEELISNTFLMLFAGHETTANTLAATIGMLALYEDVQEEVWEEIQSVAAEDHELSFESYSKLVKTQGAFLEAGRLFPAVFILMRRAAEDLILTTDEPHIHGGRLAITKGTSLVVDMVGMHYDETYFPDPEEFRPSRWDNALESQMSIFSFGSRACIGRRFALTEVVCFLARLLRTWRVEPILREGESPDEWRRRVMVPHVFMTMGVDNIPVRLMAREKGVDDYHVYISSTFCLYFLVHCAVSPDRFFKLRLTPASLKQQRRVSLALPSSPRQFPAWSFRDDTSVGVGVSSPPALVPEKKGKIRRIASDNDDVEETMLSASLAGPSFSQHRVSVLRGRVIEETTKEMDSRGDSDASGWWGVGNWKTILNDPDLKFDNRSPVDLKDRCEMAMVPNYFPDAYKHHYPNARTIYPLRRDPLIRTVHRCSVHHAQEAKAVYSRRGCRSQSGVRQTWTVWATIVKDPIFQQQNRRSTDLRDRFRNAWPDLYAKAGYKPRAAVVKKKKMDDGDNVEESSRGRVQPVRAATDDQLPTTSAMGGPGFGLFRGGVKSVPESTATTEDEDSESEDDADAFQASDAPQLSKAEMSVDVSNQDLSMQDSTIASWPELESASNAWSTSRTPNPAYAESLAASPTPSTDYFYRTRQPASPRIA
ncbi:cytochrome P450 [Irpex lacteus]|nr:cytochrome P450 [Irpex lacteus]